MKYVITIAMLFLLNHCFAQTKSNMLSPDEIKEGWTLLFDGFTTKGWHSYNKPIAGPAWKVSNGELYLDTLKKSGWQVAGGGDLLTEQNFSNFDLKLEWKIAPAANSGIMFYVQEEKKYEHAWYTGLEMQIVDNELHPDGKLKKHKAGDLYDLISCAKETVKPAGEWNQAEIISDKGSLVLLLNGEKVVSTTLWNDSWKKLVAGSKFKDMPDFGKFQYGKIALQDHGNEVSFRNIRIKKL